MQTVVTGASGFVGRHAVAALLRHGPVTALVQPGHTAPELAGCDVVEADLLQPGLRLPADTGAVLHLAAQANPQRAGQDPQAALQANVAATLNVLEACPTGARFALASTAHVYAPSPEPLGEDARVEPTSWYAATKLMAETVLRQRSATRGLRWTVVRIFNLYGPRQSPDYVVGSIVAQAAAGEVPQVRDPRPVRDFTYVVDAADLLARALREPRAAGQTYNLASGQGHSVAEIVATACSLAGLEPPAPTAGRKPEDVVRADPAKAARELGWKATTSLHDGIAACLKAARRT
ncbi:MAG: NAD-dependent epimerase/dehydratase family protein [Thermoplasmatota archaeon]